MSDTRDELQNRVKSLEQKNLTLENTIQELKRQLLTANKLIVEMQERKSKEAKESGKDPSFPDQK